MLKKYTMPNIYQNLYDVLKEAITTDNDCSKYDVLVTKSAPFNSKKFPLVVLEETTNVSDSMTLDGLESYDRLSYQVSIYTQDKTINNEFYAKNVVADDIKQVVDALFRGKYRMARSMCQDFPNLDTNVFRTLIRYECRINNRNNIIGR